MTKYTDSYRPSIKDAAINLMAKFPEALPNRVVHFMHYAILRYVQKSITKELASAFGSRINSRLLESLDLKPLLDGNQSAFELGSSMLLGTWELQVQELLEQLCPVDVFVDVGAAQGIYPVAIAKHKLAKKVIAYETIHASRLDIKRLAKSNDVDILIREEMTPATLTDLAVEIGHKKCVILLDIEGYEAELLNEDALEMLSSLGDTVLIVELHPHLSGWENNQRLISLSKKYFDVETVDSSSRVIEQRFSKFLEKRADWEIFALISEQRQIWMSWLICRPKSL